MRIRYFLALTVFTGLLASAGAAFCAEKTSDAAAQNISGASAPAGLKYIPDPAYKRLNKDDPPPMSDMVDLANEGDPRAMFILGDMSEKGKGGLEQDRKQARQWFEESAMRGYGQSFIRLAAMAKHDNNPKEAWQWYTLAINTFDSGDAEDYAIDARKALVTSAGLTSEDISQARKAIDDWKDARDKHIRAAKEAAEAKEKAQKEQAEKDAQAAKDKAEKQKAQEEQAQKDAQAEKDKAQKESAEETDADDDAVKTAAKAEKNKKQDQQEKDDEQN